MEIHNNVQGTMDTVPAIEENFNNIYLRSNVGRMTDNDRQYWMYDEIVLTAKEYASLKDANIFEGIFERMKAT